MKISGSKLISIWVALLILMLFVTIKYDLHEQPFMSLPSAKERNPQTESAGRLVWNKYGCSSCHRINGSGRKIGPDLSRVGVRHDRTWLEKQLENPKCHNAGSVMTSFSKISYTELQELVDYLARLRGTAE